MLEKEKGMIGDKDWHPGPPETFLADFGNKRSIEITQKMLELGFEFRSSDGDVETGSKITYTGERKDGTKMIIIIEKGENYKSPKELADIEKDNDNKK